MTPSIACTVEFWAFRDSWQGSTSEVLLSNFENGGWQFSVNQTAVFLKVFLDNVEQTISFPVSGMSAGWHHFAMTFDGNYLRFYVDGYQRGYVFDFKSGISNPSPGTWLTIGAEAGVNSAEGQCFTGVLDEVRIWSRSLSSSELRDWLHREITKEVNPLYIQNLILYYTFNLPEIYRDECSIIDSVSGQDLIYHQNEASESGTAPLLLPDTEQQNPRALWSAFTQGTYSEPSGGLNLGISDYNEIDLSEFDLFGHNGKTGIISTGTSDGVDLQAQRVWKIVTNHDDEQPSLRFQIFEAGAGALYYDCIPVNNYKLLYKAEATDTFRIIEVADNMEGNLVFFKNTDVKSGYYSIGRDNDVPTVSSVEEVLNITTTTAQFGGIVGCDGGAEVTAFGACWNRTGNATISDNYTIDGTGTGEFISNLDSLEPGIVYYVRSYATNSEGTAYGDELVFQTDKMYQSIIFPEIPVKTYGAPDFDPCAFASSGLPVTYTSSNSNVADIISGKLHVKGVGSSTIWAYQPGNVNYSPSSYKKMTLTVEKAHLCVEAQNKVILYGDSIPELTYEISGFVLNEDTGVLNLQPVITTDAERYSNAGYYTINVSGGDDDHYTFEYINGSLNIEKALLTVHVLDQHITYGDTLPEPDYDISGFVNGEDSTVLSEMPELRCETADLIPDAGTYEIDAYGGIANNYNIERRNGVLSVEKSILIVEAENRSITYGDSIPELNFTIAGYLEKDSLYVPEVSPKAKTEAVRFSNAGLYPIYVSGGESKNYRFEYSGGTLKIEKAELMICALDTVCAFGEAMPEFSYYVVGQIAADPNPVLIQQPLLTTDAIQFSQVGEYYIFVSEGEALNYNLQYRKGQLTIMKAIPEVLELPETSPLTEGEALLHAELCGGVSSIKGGYEFIDPSYIPDSAGEFVDVIFIPDDTVNYALLNLKVGIMISETTSVILPKNMVPSIYPNPVKSTFYLSGISYGEKLKIMDLSGTLRQEFYWSGNAISVSGFEPGVYLVLAGNQMIKFVRQ
ncbi:MBG domain-containing protein [Saccharicrinis sp. FJH54]|uniref:MBG domain-containing protein n=1 Tax=Saccharicrinis sp. FJH54 TaxID=3344665 RepID=UPI0035D3E8C3